MSSVTIHPLGENALTISFGNKISKEVNNLVIRLDAFIAKHGFSGFVETVSAYSSLTVFYDSARAREAFAGFPTAFAGIKSFVENALENLNSSKKTQPRLVEIPVCFADVFAPDLEFVAKKAGIFKSEVIEIFTARTYRVYMLGFLPGFPYMGEVDEMIAVPRKESPRLAVPKGSVGIAGLQTGIYPLESPGGWQIIGKTHLELFTPFEKNPCLLQTGDSVKFFAVDDIGLTANKI